MRVLVQPIPMFNTVYDTRSVLYIPTFDLKFCLFFRTIFSYPYSDWCALPPVTRTLLLYSTLLYFPSHSLISLIHNTSSLLSLCTDTLVVLRIARFTQLLLVLILILRYYCYCYPLILDIFIFIMFVSLFGKPVPVLGNFVYEPFLYSTPDLCKHINYRKSNPFLNSI